MSTLATVKRRLTFSSYSAWFVKSRQFYLYDTCIWRLRWGWPHLSFDETFRTRKLESLSYHVALFAWSCV